MSKEKSPISTNEEDCSKVWRSLARRNETPTTAEGLTLEEIHKQYSMENKDKYAGIETPWVHSSKSET